MTYLHLVAGILLTAAGCFLILAGLVVMQWQKTLVFAGPAAVVFVLGLAVFAWSELTAPG